MARAYVSDVLPAPVGAVWAVLGRFEAIADFVEKLASGHLEDGSKRPSIGAVRVLRLTEAAGGGQVRERLVSADAVDRSYSYEFPPAANPFPVRSYRATIRVRPVTSSGHTFVEWYGDFDADADIEEEMRAAFSSRYISFLGDLGRHLGLD